MKIAVIGAGAIGSIIAGYLHKAGEDVVLVGRQAHVEAINQKGLRVHSAERDETINVPAVTKLDRKCDLAIFCVKTQDLEDAYQDNHEFCEYDMWILTTQNGVQADNMISSHFDKVKVISSIVMFGATFISPGEITLNFEGDWIIGKPFMPNDPFLQELGEILRKAFSVVITPDIVGMKWLKLFVNFNNCLPALIGKSMQETFSDMDFCRLSIRLLKEGVRVVDKAGVEMVSLPNFPLERISGLINMPEEQAAGIMNKTLTSLSKEPLYGSILQSILRKKPSEIDFINGEVVLLAKNLYADATLNRRVVDLVHRVENSGEFLSKDEVKQEFGLKS